MRYLVQAEYGRKAGAIGGGYPIAVVAEAGDAEAALLRAYKYVEHLVRPVAALEADSVLQRGFVVVPGD